MKLFIWIHLIIWGVAVGFCTFAFHAAFGKLIWNEKDFGLPFLIYSFLWFLIPSFIIFCVLRFLIDLFKPYLKD